MPTIDKLIAQVVGEVSTVLNRIDRHEAETFARELLRAERIFVLGEGRSGLMGKAFAMRLMHAGWTVYVVGETITPSIKPGDLLIALSGSGNTSSVFEAAEKGKKAGANLLSITTQPDSKIGRISDGTLTVPATTKYRRKEEPDTIQPLGNQFDQSLHLLLDALIIYAIGDRQTNSDMVQRHGNLK
ncbi:6-phospho-3-hexuloisomerase [Melghirimyces thermohalophilus]|uniref:6-phospho-3-hexuloisomerase n=1 Tax=Melghirimyces thermohalophilus TaxID=1236220 RepID=A0A1G6NWN0_9BACL|nr:6-phospho-3-hexuloisomerase [Melghirimyces thermohalophilus]SDC71656.1 6-phospho-3-hexuloisomerase [Melghirimyces thermohalophilus]